MEKIEFTKYEGNFEKMRASNPKYKNSDYFGFNVNFREASAPAEYKEEMFTIYPESKKHGQSRGVTLVE